MGESIVIVLGAGVVGRAAAHYAAALPGVASLIVADRDFENARSVLAEAGGRGEARAVDVTDDLALQALLGRGDAVLNCVGPFYRFGPPVLAAAIAAGRPYLDICDDWEPTLAMLGQAEAARRAGVTAVVGQGASPGTANLIAASVVAALPDATTLITGWSLDDDPGDVVSAANEHWLHQSTGVIRLLRDGAMADDPPLRELEVAFPGLPSRPAHTVGHPEAVTLPHLTTCLNVMTLPRALTETLRRAARAVDADGLSIRDAAQKVLVEHRPGHAEDWPTYLGVWAIAEGPGGRAGAFLRDYGTMTDMATTTAAPLVAGLDLLLRGEARGTGVLTPEQAFAPKPYFAALGRVAGIKGEVLDLWREP